MFESSPRPLPPSRAQNAIRCRASYKMVGKLDRVVLSSAVAMSAISLIIAGCHRDIPGATKKLSQQTQQDQLRQVDRAEALIKAAAAQLADMPGATDVEMRPPVVVLDSRNSADHQDVYAVCIANPAVPGNPINVLRVATNNGRFKGLALRQGDLLRFYVIQDETVDEESRNIGMSRQKAINLKVAQVVDDNTLLIEGALSQPVVIPGKLEVWRTVDVRQRDVIRRLDDYATYRRPARGWEPAPDDAAMTQILAWLNQWIRQSNPPSTWKRDSLVDSLPEELRSHEVIKPILSNEQLGAKSFEPHDGRIVQEAVWLRDISRWAHGDAFDDVGRAAALFDWTVRNIQLDADADAVPQRPWQTLLYGHGTADQRAWVFAGLCRQRGIPVVLVGIPLAKPADAHAAVEYYWLAAVVANNQLHLFDPRLGLPIAGPEGKSVATLDQITKDDALLRKLDLEDMQYPLTAELAKAAQMGIVADAFSLSRRASQLEANLTGEDHISLAVKASELADQLKSVAGVEKVALWEMPFRTLLGQLTLGKSARSNEALAFEPFAVRPLLWKARTRQFQGRRKVARTPGSEEVNDHEEAVRLYMSKSVRPTDREIAASPSDGEQRVETVAKLNATYWLGLLSFDDGKFSVAGTWFQRPELAAGKSGWAAGAKYNLARSLEAEQKFEEAAAILETDTSAQQHGNKLLARELRSRPAAKPADAAK